MVCNLDLSLLMSELASDCGLDSDTTQYCIRRLKNEGYKFWSCTLPGFSKYILRSIEAGYLLPKSCFTSIEWKGTLPRYFRGLILQMFRYDSSSGRYVSRSDSDALALWQIRQFCEYLYKLQMPFSEEEMVAAEKRFCETEATLDEALDYRFLDRVKNTFEYLFPELLCEASTPFKEFSAEAGPGTFSGGNTWKGLYETDKKVFKEYPSGAFVSAPGGTVFSPDYVNKKVNSNYGDIEKYPWYVRKDVDYSYPPSFAHFKKALTPTLSWCKPYVSKDPDYSEVLFVPKDSRGPRVIVREPFSKLRADSVYFKWLVKNLEKKTDYRVNFADQTKNRDLAKQASKDKTFATLDLKDASDRVRADVCEYVFASSPAMMFFFRRRVKNAKLPVSGRLFPLRKLAGMGSYLTFSTMSLLIYVTSVRSVFDRFGGSLSLDEIKRDIYVYGDDVIVPSGWYSAVISGLERVGLLVNVDKSFLNSNFRESCGGDYLNGEDVSPVRLKLTSCQLIYKNGKLVLEQNTKGQRSQFYLNLERHARELIKNGMLSSAELIYKCLERWLGPLPVGSGDHPYFCRYSNRSVPYECDETGLSRKISVWTCVPAVFSEVHGLDTSPAIYRSLNRNFKDSVVGATESVERLFAKAVDFNNDKWSIPRTQNLVRRTVRAFALAGS